jgi:hypothetical protein
MKEKCEPEGKETPKSEQKHSSGFLRKALSMKKSGKSKSMRGKA